MLSFRIAFALVLSFGVVTAGRPAAAEVDVLFRSGQTDTEGFALAGFDRPRGAGGAVVVRGRTSALLTKQGDTVAELLRTGDALPGPFSGSFNRFRTPVVNGGGAVVFLATINSSAGAEGLFYREGATVIPIAITADQGTIGSFDINDTGNVAYVRDDTLYLWDRATTTSLRLAGRGDNAPGGGVFRRLGRVAVNATDIVAFAASRRNAEEGIFTAGRNVNVGFVASRRFGDGPVAINAAGQIAFSEDGRANSDSFIRVDPGVGVVKVLSKGTSVGGAGKVLTIDPECAAIDDSGRVVLEAQFDAKNSPRRLVVVDGSGPRAGSDVVGRTATDFTNHITDGQVVYIESRRIQRFDVESAASATEFSGTTETPLGVGISPETPSHNASGVTAFAGARESIESISNGVATPLVAVGTKAIVGALTPDTITAIGSHAVFQNQVAFVTTVGTVDSAIVSLHDGRIEPVVVPGTTSTPVGGTFGSISDFLEVQDDGVLFLGSVSGGRASAGVFHVSLVTKKIRAIALSARKGANRLENLNSPSPTAGGTAFRADRRNKGALYLAGGKNPKKLLAFGQKAPEVGGVVSGLRAFVGTNDGVLGAVTVDGGDADSAIYRIAGRGKPRVFITDGGVAPGGGSYQSVGSAVMASNGSTAAFLVPLFGAAGARGLFSVSGDTVTLRLLDDAVLDDASRLSLVDTDVLAFEGDAIVLAGRLSGTSTASRALVAVH